MEKVKFETKQDYITYCQEHGIVNIPRKYASQYVDIDDGNEYRTDFVADKYCSEHYYINTEPESYPCILVWDEYSDMIFGNFIYPNDFKKL